MDIAGSTIPESPRPKTEDTSSSAKCSNSSCASRMIGKWLIVILISAGASYGGWQWYIRHRANWGVVVNGEIFRSSQVSRFLIREKLETNKIAVIVSLLGKSKDDKDVDAEIQLAGELGIQFRQYPMDGDGIADPGQYTGALSAIIDAKQAHKPVLVHCHAGAQRTGGVIAVYRLLIEGKSIPEALTEMTSHGFNPKKNIRLLPFLNKHMEHWAQELYERKIITSIPEKIPQFPL